ncbi:nuclear transport factor 2 family protein [Frondihabitans australicus]|uniref:SnoaL-like protein n=1 Tax=Frondihabitans australicus TaxID=386892 RepID=A0A495IJA0_9MICO|nr:nuclear transport factor 2 family protein [Frondihabitans australicus]RKR75859.1 SnoaL-like protein [Frondihabitans australicus]
MTLITIPKNASTEAKLQALVDENQIVDAIHRYTAGLDFGDADLLESALTEDATVDLSLAMAKIGYEFPPLTPRSTIMGGLLPAVGPLDTSHRISNVRVAITGDTATLTCYAQAQHYLPGHGPKPEETRQALMMNRYQAELVRSRDSWRIQTLLIDNAWFSGDPTILIG